MTWLNHLYDRFIQPDPHPWFTAFLRFQTAALCYFHTSDWNHHSCVSKRNRFWKKMQLFFHSKACYIFCVSLNTRLKSKLCFSICFLDQKVSRKSCNFEPILPPNQKHKTLKSNALSNFYICRKYLCLRHNCGCWFKAERLYRDRASALHQRDES